MNTISKLFSIAVLVLSSTLSISCSKESTPNNIIPTEAGKVFIKVNGQIGEFTSEDQTRADLANVVRVSWTGSERVYVYEGATYRGYVDAPADIADDRVAELSGTITAPSNPSAKLTFVYSDLFAGEPTVTDGKITVDLTTQSLDSGKIPFVIYGFADYASTTIDNLVVPFQFATSALTASVTGLNASTAISSATLSGVNTKCVLTLGAGSVTPSGETVGTITRDAGLGSANANGTAFVKFAVPVSASADKSLNVYQDEDRFYKINFANNAISANLSIGVITGLSHYEPSDGTINGHAWVRLWDGGPKWATMNVGASAPQQDGDYYAWGETQTYYQDGYARESLNNGHWKEGKTGYDNASYGGLSSKYSSSDSKDILDISNDVAHQSWGGSWRIPTVSEWTDLLTNCNWEWTTNYQGTGAAGGIVTAKPGSVYYGNSIFLPITGAHYDNIFMWDATCCYWSSSLKTTSRSYAYYLYWYSNKSVADSILAAFRYYGIAIRPIAD